MASRSIRVILAALATMYVGCGQTNRSEPDGMPGDASGPDTAADVCDSAACRIAPPRPVAPLSTSTVTSHRPLFRWVRATGSDGVRVEVCRDRACTLPVSTLDTSDAMASLPTALDAGVYFWRLRGTLAGDVGTATGPVWQFAVTNQDSSVNTSWGTSPDLDGDGYADVLVGAPSEAPDFANRPYGRAYVYRGSSIGVVEGPMNTLQDRVAGYGFGIGVSSAGDVDGDGFADLVVGSARGAHVLLGGPNGPTEPPVVVIPDPYGDHQSGFGNTVTSAGDVDGDGYADVLVGAANAHQGKGAVYLYAGRPGGPSTVPAREWVGATDDGLGAGLAGAGDVNGDGYADVAAFAAGHDHGRGETLVFLGSASGTSDAPATTIAGRSFYRGAIGAGGDLNGDGYADVLMVDAGNSSTDDAGAVFLGGPDGIPDAPNSTFLVDETVLTPRVSIASAGDVNGDGFADAVIGVENQDPFNRAPFRVSLSVFVGGPAGLARTPAMAIAPQPDMQIDLFEFALANAGDLNGDGRADVVVGARSMAQTGGVLVFNGSSDGLEPTPSKTLDGHTTDGQFGYSVARRRRSTSHRASCRR